MTKTKKQPKNRSIAILAIVALVSFVGGSNAFADFQAVNNQTGFESTNEVSATGTDGFSLTNANTEVIANSGDGSGNTGDNVVDNNTGEAIAISGDLDVNGSFSNEVNLNSAEHTGSWWEGDFGAINDTTGALSLNSAVSDFESALEANNLNEVDIDNSATVEGNTGDNSASDNTLGGGVRSGDISARILEGNTANGNEFSLEGDMGNLAFDSLAKNLFTGAESDNDATVDIDNSLTATNTNDADVVNDAFVSANTGGNEADFNTSDGEVFSGDALADVILRNDANSNFMDMMVSGAGGDLMAVNDTTGAESDNDATATLNNDVDATNSNNADIENNVEVALNTGGNTANDNTGDSEMRTGDAKGKVEIENGSSLNENITRIEMDMGNSGVSAVNDTTGFSSDNDATASLTNDVDVVNTNELDLDNNVDVLSNTGENEANNNTGDTRMITGDAEGRATIVNDANLNDTRINISPNMGVEAGNSFTGAESDNDATASAVNEIDVVNTNNAEINNDVVITTNSGGNTSSGNTGNSGLATGDAKVVFSASNSSNQNTTVIGD